MNLRNVVLPAEGHGRESCNIKVDNGFITSIGPCEASWSDRDYPPSLLLPALCHPHIHLDKAYILTCNRGPSPAHPDYTDLRPESGSFTEAMSNTSRAKERYTAEDLYLRGSQLLATSYRQGVTSLRAFVELDHVTGTLPLATAIRLKRDLSHLVHVQICAFAQDPVFSTEHGETNRSIITSALHEYGESIDALGVTPYVEQTSDASLRNIEWAVGTALEHHLHLDFHLDYNLDPASTPLTPSVVDILLRRQWPTGPSAPTVVLGHCTRLTVLPRTDLASLAQRIVNSGLPVYFVGLPTSDLFMMGRPGSSPGSDNTPHSRARATLQIPSLIKDFGLSACLGVNNVGNAFTPYGTGDPLQLACLGVGLYQAGTEEDTNMLYSAVSWRAREAIGLRDPYGNDKLAKGCRWRPMLCIENKPSIALPGKPSEADIMIPARPRLRLTDVVWDPPELSLRSIV